MHSIYIAGISLLVGVALGWFAKGKFGTGVAAIEADAKKL
jgi:hypothetical protein